MVRVMLFSSLSQDQTHQDEVSADCTLLLSYSGQTLLTFILSSDITERGSLTFGEKLLLGYLIDLGVVSSLCFVNDAVNCRDLKASVTVELTFRHRASSILKRRFAILQRTLFIYLINKYISLFDISLTVI